MVVAVVTVGMVQLTFHQVVDMIAVRHGLVATAGAVLMARLVPRAFSRVAFVRMLGVNGDAMLIDVAIVRVVQMPVMQVIGVAVMANRDVPTAGAVLMVVVAMYLVIDLSHQDSFVPVGCKVHANPWRRWNLAIGHENHSQTCRGRPNPA